MPKKNQIVDTTEKVKEPKVDLGAGTGIKKQTDAEKIKQTEDELLMEIDDNFRIAYDAMKEWAEVAKEDIEFAAGKQWLATDESALKLQGRPVLTFNKIKPIIKLLTGHLIQNNARITAVPEGGEDQIFSEVMDRMIDDIDERTQLNFHLGYLFAGGQKSGRGWIEFYYDYGDDPIFGNLKCIYHGRPNTIFPDPRGTAYDLSDREFLFKVVKKTKSELRDLYPDKDDIISQFTLDIENPLLGGSQVTAVEGDRNNYGIDPNRSQTGINRSTESFSDLPERSKQFTVKEYWRLKREKKWFVYFVETGDMPRFDSKEEAEAEVTKRRIVWEERKKAQYAQSAGLDPNSPEMAAAPIDLTGFKTVLKERKVKVMFVAVKSGGRLLTNGESPMEPYFSGFPFFPYIADWHPEAEREVERIQGIVRSLKDPQREKNKSHSQWLHILNTQANSGWIIDDDSMTDAKKTDLKSFGAVPGIIVEKKKGSDVRKIEPSAPNVGQLERTKQSSDDFKEVSGINSDLLAIDQSSNPSGKAIALRIRQAITILEPDFRNFRYTKKLIGEFLFKIIPTLYDVPKMKKVLGEDFLGTNQIDDSKLAAALVMIEDGRYNVRIAEQGDTKSLREETFEDLTNMMQNGMQIPFDVMAEFMTIPNKAEIITKIKAYQQQQQQAAIAMANAKKGGGAGPGVGGAEVPTQ